MSRSRIGPLALESKLGDHPSQSCVWRAIHVELKRAVAVKIFAALFGGTPDARASFSQEWESLRKLSHSSIARCYGGGFEGTDSYLAYELIEGETLSSQLERRGRLPWESVLEIAEPLADALEYLHQQGIAFGRIQPDKIIIAGLSPVLIDPRVYRMGTPFCTGKPPSVPELSLQAPEMIAQVTPPSFSGDLYAMGALMYLMLTGRAPIVGETAEEVLSRSKSEIPAPVATIILDVPVWLDKLIAQLLQKKPAARLQSAGALKLALVEVRKRTISKSGVAEQASAGFSPLNVTNQKQRDEARLLLGRELVDFDSSIQHDHSQWFEKAMSLMAILAILIGGVAYLVWPLNENQMREKAEAMLAEETRSSMSQARISYLEPMLRKYPDGEHADWATEQLDRVRMIESEHALEVKIKRNLPLKNEAERLYAEALQYERFGDVTTALDRYRGMVTLLEDEAEYRPFVNLARRQISVIEGKVTVSGEASRIVQSKLEEADKEFAAGNVVAARRIWYSLVELYGNNANVAPLITRAQERLAINKQAPESSSIASP